jgi:hypothetical protein
MTAIVLTKWLALDARLLSRDPKWISHLTHGDTVKTFLGRGLNRIPFEAAQVNPVQADFSQH